MAPRCTGAVFGKQVKSKVGYRVGSDTEILFAGMAPSVKLSESSLVRLVGRGRNCLREVSEIGLDDVRVHLDAGHQLVLNSRARSTALSRTAI